MSEQERELNLSVEETNVFKGILDHELDLALSQLHELQNQLQDAEFTLKTPEYYEVYQRLFLSMVMSGIEGAANARELN